MSTDVCPTCAGLGTYADSGGLHPCPRCVSASLREGLRQSVRVVASPAEMRHRIEELEAALAPFAKFYDAVTLDEQPEAISIADYKRAFDALVYR